MGGALASFSGKDGKSLSKDAAFFSTVVAGNFGKTLLLQFHRSVDGATVTSALKDSLAKKLEPATLEEFAAALNTVLKDGVQPNTKLYFMCGGDTLGIAAGTTTVAASADAKVCAALMDTYYGADPVSHQAKDGMARGAARLLA